MKKLTSFAPFMAAALMVGCAKDANLEPTIGQNDLEGAYVSIQIATPSVTRGDIPDEPGTAEESDIQKVRLLIFDKDYNYIGLGEQTAATKANTYTFEVAPDAFRFFAIVNPTSTIDDALDNINGNWNNVEQALQTVLSLESSSDIATYSTDNHFPMVNAGSYVDNKESILVFPADGVLVNGKLSTEETAPTPVNIVVDRMVAKFTANIAEDFKVSDHRTGTTDPGEPYGKVEGVRLNVINKKSYVYSHIKQVNAKGDDYRGDPNMSVANCEALPNGEETELTKNFFWLHNYDSPVFNDASNGYSEYVFENTATGEFFNYNNLTQLVVKATYLPTGQPDPDDLPADMTTNLTHIEADEKSWFAISIEDFGTMQMTFKGVVAYYTKTKAGIEGQFAPDPVTCAKMDRQLQHMLASAEDLGALTDPATATWDDPNLTCAILNSIPNGGYVAATVDNEEDYIVQFYQFGLNYYDIFIQHDETQKIGHLGRWGMVRNNHYTLSINSISGPGLPYVPDPTDPEIKDPQNPDPKDPEPADKDMAYIDATITVNPWTMWTQGVDLN